MRAAIAHAQRCHGPDRFPVIVQQALLRYAFLDVDLRARSELHGTRTSKPPCAPRSAWPATTANERSGLFGLRARRLGEREYASRIEGRLQNVAGVLWCKVTALGRFAAGVHRSGDAGAAGRAARPLATSCRAAPHELLQLARAHLTLTAVAEPSAGECA